MVCPFGARKELFTYPERLVQAVERMHVRPHRPEKEPLVGVLEGSSTALDRNIGASLSLGYMRFYDILASREDLYPLLAQNNTPCGTHSAPNAASHTLPSQRFVPVEAADVLVDPEAPVGVVGEHVELESRGTLGCLFGYIFY